MKNILAAGVFTIFTATTFTTQAQTATIMENVFQAMPKRDAQIEAYLKEKQLYHVKASPDGIYYIVEEAGQGTQVNPGDFVTVHYTGRLLDGTKFDSSKDRNEPFTFRIGQGQVIQGWEKGIPLFNAGGKGTIFLPSGLAYGEQGAGGVIPPNAPLIFEIEVVDVTDQQTYIERQKALQLKLQAEAEARRGEQAKKDKEIIAKYAADNQLTLQYLPSGLAYIITEEGTGPQVTAGKTAVVHYTGKLLDGTKFDSSKDRNQPFPVPVGANRVIQGWEQGLPLFKAGSKGTLIIPSTLAYGERGAGGIIKPNSVLIFDIEVLEVK